MTKLRTLARHAVRIGAAAGLAAIGLAAAPQPAGASTYTSISGSGSSWASVALDQWSSNVRQNGLVANYNPDGSAAGRQDYINDQVDFTGSDPPFRDGQDELGGTGAENSGKYGFSYVPDTAGGTAFMYHITVAGHLIANLRLHPLTIMKIFTGNITNWDDKTITHDYGAQLPSLPITPVVRSDGSGATYFLTRWMEHLDPSLWNKFCQRVHHVLQGIARLTAVCHPERPIRGINVRARRKPISQASSVSEQVADGHRSRRGHGDKHRIGATDKHPQVSPGWDKFVHRVVELKQPLLIQHHERHARDGLAH